MMPRQTAALRTRGFNLVEIAVVLVVIGLIMGGILRGTELINSAKARNMIDQKSSIQTAVLAFSNRYKATAGDLTLAQRNFIGNAIVFDSTSTPGDGAIALTQPGAATDESVLVFQNLTATGFLTCSSCTATRNAIASNANSPINANGSYLQYGTTASSTIGIFWLDAAIQPGRNMLTTGAQVPAAILQQIDIKADDGLPATGLFRQSTTGSADTTANCTSNAATAWATNGTANCAGAWLF